MTGTVAVWEDVYWEGIQDGITEGSDDGGWVSGYVAAFKCGVWER